MFEQGQAINDGEKNLIICDTLKINNKVYIYVLNEDNYEVGFYEVLDTDDSYNFKLVKDEKIIREIMLLISKKFLSKVNEESSFYTNIVNQKVEDVAS